MRRRALFVLIAAAATSWSAQPRAQAARIPTFCDITAAQKEVQAGARVTFTVTLKNVKDMPVAAIADTTVTLTSESFAAPVQVVVQKGQESATTSVVMSKAGIGRVKASAPTWPAAFTIVPVKPVNVRHLVLPESASSKDVLQRMGGAGGAIPITTLPAGRAPAPPPPPPAGTAAGRAGSTRGGVPPSRLGRGALAGAEVPPGRIAPPEPPPPTVPAPEPGAVALDVQVNPEEVYPRARQWAADIIVLLLSGDGTLAVADRDLQLQLSSRVGQVEPRTATIHAGDSSTASTPIRLTSSQSGDEIVTALSTVARATHEVKFDEPQVASLRVAVTPGEVVSDGRAVANVAVLLQDADGRVTTDQSRDVKVHLDSDLGTFEKPDLRIAKGEPSDETTFTSPRYGTATIKATAVGIEGVGSVDLLFPWAMLALSIAGGAGGSFAREGVGKRRRGGPSPLVRHLALGALFGVIFFGLAMFGAVGAIPKLEIDVGRIIPLNEIGALVLGFIGGYLGNRFWAGDGEAAAPKKP